MSEHLPECPCVHHPSEDLWCICWRLRECSTRTTAFAVQRVEALPEYALRDTCIAALRESHD